MDISLTSIRQFLILCSAGYTKLLRYWRQSNFIVKKAVFIPSGHFCSFAGLEVIFNKIVACQLIVKIMRMTLCFICSNTKHICTAASIKRGIPCFPEIWSNVGKQNIFLPKLSCFARGNNICRNYTAIMRKHIIGGNVGTFIQTSCNALVLYDISKISDFQRITS